MLDVTSFHERRKENIRRNNDLLRKLNLAGLSSEIEREVGANDKPKPKCDAKKKVIKKRTKSEDNNLSIPRRRSRRLQGAAIDGTGIPNVSDNELMKLVGNNGGRSQQIDELQELKETRVVGDIKLKDLIKVDSEDDLIDKFKVFAGKGFSSGDFFQELQKHQELTSEIKQLQRDFRLSPYKLFDPKEIAIGHERISAICFHPSQEKKLIAGGDTNGTLGLWSVTDSISIMNEDVEGPDITRFRLFTKSISKIEAFPTDNGKLLVSAYDGSLRSINLNNMKSEAILTLNNSFGDPLGISDYQFSYDNPNILYMVTLSGEFTQFDLRTKPDPVKFMRLSDKKVGSMAVNPNNSNEIVTGSLDRSLKIWDLRKTVLKPEWSQYEDFPSHQILAIYNSKLSVSAVSYSPAGNTLICNGYDNTIRLFNMNSTYREKAELRPALTIQHNCKTGRWVSILKARFKQNKDLFAIANMKRAIDIYTSSGEQLAHIPTSTVPAVLGWHPIQNWIVGGNSSGKIYLFTDDNKE